MNVLALLIAWVLAQSERNKFAAYDADKWLKKYGAELVFLPENEFTEIGGITFFLHEETLMASRRGFCENGKITEPSEILKRLFSKLDSVDFY